MKNPSQYVQVMMERCQTRHIERTYGVKDWSSDEDFLEKIARKSGRLLKGGEADLDAVAKTILNDFLRGRIPWFTAPPKAENGEEGIEGREGRLGEMRSGGKRKRDGEADEGSDVSDEFEGFEDEDELSRNAESSEERDVEASAMPISASGVASDGDVPSEEPTGKQ